MPVDTLIHAKLVTGTNNMDVLTLYTYFCTDPHISTSKTYTFKLRESAREIFFPRPVHIAGIKRNERKEETLACI